MYVHKAKIGLIGCGRRARSVFLPTIVEGQKRGFFNLTSVCDITENVARETGETYHVPYYASAEKMLEKEKDMDFVCIVANDYQHHLLGKLAADYGKHFLIEKPMAITLPCCDLMIKACEKAGVYYEVSEQYIKGPTDRAVMEIIKNGLIGDVSRVYVNDPEPAHASDSGICMDMGVHCMSEIRTYVGNEPTQVNGLTKTFVAEKRNSGVLHEDWGIALVEFEKGQIGTCECATAVWNDPSKNTYRQIIGTEGAIYVDARGNVIEGTISLRKKQGENLADIPVEKKYNKVVKGFRFGMKLPGGAGFNVLEKIVVKTNPEIVWRNPYAGYDLVDTRVGVMSALMSIADAALNDKPAEYGINARKDVEMCVAWYESSLKKGPVRLPLTSMTDYEKMVNEDYRRIFGHDPTDL